MNGMVEMDDLAEDFKVIDERLSVLGTKRINFINLKEKSDNPAHNT